jgi:hypothetical protein
VFFLIGPQTPTYAQAGITSGNGGAATKARPQSPPHSLLSRGRSREAELAFPEQRLQSDTQSVVVITAQLLQCALVVVVIREPCISAPLLPLCCLRPRLLHAFSHLVITSRELLYGYVQRRTLILPRMLLVQQFGNISDGGLENGAFVLVGARNDLGQLVDAFIDRLPATSLNCAGQSISTIAVEGVLPLPSLWLSFRCWCHCCVPTAGLL